MSDFPVVIEPEAVVQMKRLLARKGAEGSFVRIGVKGGGCSGLAYMLKIETKRFEIDQSLMLDGLEVVCDAKSAEFLRGSTLRYTGNLASGGYEFVNPNAQRSCGCGTSFLPKEKEQS